MPEHAGLKRKGPKEGTHLWDAARFLLTASGWFIGIAGAMQRSAFPLDGVRVVPWRNNVFGFGAPQRMPACRQKVFS